ISAKKMRCALSPKIKSKKGWKLSVSGFIPTSQTRCTSRPSGGNSRCRTGQTRWRRSRPNGRTPARMREGLTMHNEQQPPDQYYSEAFIKSLHGQVVQMKGDLAEARSDLAEFKQATQRNTEAIDRVEKNTRD